MQRPDSRSPEERREARAAFEVAMRQAVMEFDAADGDSNAELDFREFSRMIREREIGIHSEKALKERFDSIDADCSGAIDVGEFITFALRDAFVRSAPNLKEIFAEWDADGNGIIDRDEFKAVVRHFGFQADDKLIDNVFDLFDSNKQGRLELKDLSTRLQREVKARKRPMHRLRCMEWRDNAHVQVVTLDTVKVDPKAPMAEQIKLALRSQMARVIDLFRSWDAE